MFQRQSTILSAAGVMMVLTVGSDILGLYKQHMLAGLAEVNYLDALDAFEAAFRIPKERYSPKQGCPAQESISCQAKASWHLSQCACYQAGRGCKAKGRQARSQESYRRQKTCGKKIFSQKITLLS